MTAPATAAAPLAATLERIAALDAYVSAALLPAPGAGWVRASELLAPQAGDWLDETLGQLVARYSLDRPKTAASFFVGSYVWYLAGAAIGCLLLERRVPLLAAEHVAARLVPGSVEFALLDPGFAALADDPAAGQPGVRVLDGPAALNELLRAQIEGHMARLIELVAERSGLGRRAQWNLTADTCARLFLWLGQKTGQAERGCDEGLALIKAPGSPMRPSKTSYLTLEEAGRRETFYLRGGCCMTYKIPGAAKCSNCPLQPREECERRLRAGMAQS
ncbi:MAG TPA: (2Fe-2S)-binding protein [Herpetosiphonaceae bacterium]